MIPLGAFELQSRLGEGGMGEVWRGVHRSQHVPVAVKLLTTSLARKTAFRAAFRNEVRAVAGLDHPNIVLVFDYGTVDAAAQEASDGVLRAGTPWLAMELAEDGSLDAPGAVRSWPQLRGVLLSLLDALAHAHARGVVHRDIKPGNVLIAKGRALKLTDFGLAHAMDRQEGDFVAGTPSYMAPEQFHGRWRDYGPWTDLYAVGCMVYALAGGGPPFGWVESWHEGQRIHDDCPPPVLRPHFSVPPGLHEWVRMLLAKDPRDRWRRCADASSALLSLPSTVESAFIEPSFAPPAGVLPTVTRQLAAVGAEAGAGAALCPTETRPLAQPAPSIHPVTTPLPAAEPPPRDAEGSGMLIDRRVAPAAVRAGHPIPPVPPAWKRPQPPARSPRLVGAGLGLFGLRTIPFVGRLRERELLWDSLRRVHREGEAHAVVIQGPGGCGKSRLARWVAERAHEVGGASVLMGAPRPGATAEDVLADLLLDWLRCRGLDRASMLPRVAAHLASVGILQPEAWERAVGLLAGKGAPADRRGGLVSLLVQLAVERPLVVFLDDAHLATAAIDLVRAVVENEGFTPILWVFTVSEEERLARQAVSVRLEALRQHPRVHSLSLGPLAEAHRAALVRQLLGLEGSLAIEVERRTGGHPHFAVQLVGEWVQRGLLEPGRRGFRLKDGALPDVPSDLAQIWAGRVERYLKTRPMADAIALELAAVLGMDVRWAEWHAACELAGVEASEDLVEGLLGRHLACCGPEGPTAGWSFIHGLVREVLEGRARDAGRLERHHLRCAAMLDDRDGRGVPERLAEHLLALGRDEHAVGPLLAAIDERLAAGEHAMANALLARRDAALTGTPVAMAHAEGWVRWGRLAVRLGRLGDAKLWADQAEQHARRERWGRVLVDSVILQGRIARLRGDTTRAWRTLFEAEQLAMGDPTRWRLGLARIEIGRLQAQRGHLDKAADALREGRGDLEAAGDLQAVGAVFVELAAVSLQRGRLGASRVLIEWAQGRFRWLRCRLGVARCRLLTARLCRLSAELALAADAVHDALDEMRNLGSAEVMHAELELGLLDMARGDLAQAQHRASGVLRHWDIHEARPAAARAHGLLLELAVRSGDQDRAAHHAQRVKELVDATGVVDRDLAAHCASAAAGTSSPSLAEALRVLHATQAARLAGPSPRDEAA